VLLLPHLCPRTEAALSTAGCLTAVDFAGDKVKAGVAGDSTAASAGLDRQVGWGRCGFF